MCIYTRGVDGFWDDTAAKLCQNVTKICLTKDWKCPWIIRSCVKKDKAEKSCNKFGLICVMQDGKCWWVIRLYVNAELHAYA